MHRKLFPLILSGLMLLSACGGQSTAEDAQVASAEEMAAVESVVEDWMVPISGNQLKDGEYSITVDSSSSMFQPVACTLTVENGEMTAKMTMGGQGYLKVYPGTGAEAAAADETDCIPFEEDAMGNHTYTIPVPVLDQGVDCASFSKNKEKWYERTLVFRSDSLPLDAFDESTLTTVESLGLSDGAYTVEVTVSGGSGRASVQSPASLRIENGEAYVTLVWSSSNFDYMEINGVRFDPLTLDPTSTFEVPVLCFDKALPMSADTTAMSTPYLINYNLTFSSETMQEAAG